MPSWSDAALVRAEKRPAALLDGAARRKRWDAQPPDQPGFIPHFPAATRESDTLANDERMLNRSKSARHVVRDPDERNATASLLPAMAAGLSLLAFVCTLDGGGSVPYNVRHVVTNRTHRGPDRSR